MRVLVACEFSGRVREAFRRNGHDAVSCDIIPADDGSPFHIQDDVLRHLDGWDLMVAHPPCTYLATSGARWFSSRVVEQAAALDFVRALMAAPIDRIALENPVSVISGQIRKPDQVIHPWQFGHGEKKRTCLWLKNLPKLTPTDIVDGREQKILNMAGGPNRQKMRSITYQGIANAMADQWGKLEGVS